MHTNVQYPLNTPLEYLKINEMFIASFHQFINHLKLIHYERFSNWRYATGKKNVKLG